jgi:hypothetical protein
VIKIQNDLLPGYCFFLASGVITWSSKKQTFVALSNIESEYMALSKATIKAIWIHKLLLEIGFPQTTPTKIYLDNQNAIAFTANPKFHFRSNHNIDTQYHLQEIKFWLNKLHLNIFQLLKWLRIFY